MPSPFQVGWFYVVSEDAGAILKRLFEGGIKPGSVVTIDPADFQILKDEVLTFPIHSVNSPKLVSVPGGFKGARAS